MCYAYPHNTSASTASGCMHCTAMRGFMLHATRIFLLTQVLLFEYAPACLPVPIWIHDTACLRVCSCIGLTWDYDTTSGMRSFSGPFVSLLVQVRIPMSS